MRVYSYVVRSDSGFAPNPFFGFCTLACCKPVIRRTAHVGDWVVGLSSRCRGIVYVMRVTEKMSFTEYWRDPRFLAKRPEFRAPSIRDRCGDNIYRPVPGGGFAQLPSGHSNPDGSEHPGVKAHDLRGKSVLVSEEFVYFGANARPLPESLQFLRVRRGHRCHFTKEQVGAFLDEVSSIGERGINGRPMRWLETDDSWQSSSSAGRGSTRRQAGCRARS